ncbi:MAG: GAF domain-containing protein [Bacillota bacterium]|nr:GAF domain-containing protein [Bacillota bacterium]
MIKVDGLKDMTIEERYKYMTLMVGGQLKTEKDLIANLSNISAVLNSGLEDINWVGFYLMKDGELVLGPFQGLPACNRIKVGEGVCGNAVKFRKTLRIENVHEFDGHIACDSASNSEIVIPLIKADSVIGVLDIDSPLYSRFSEVDQKKLSSIVSLIEEYI